MAQPLEHPALGSAERNALLRDLDRDDYEAVARHLEEVRLEPGEILVEPGRRPTYVYFPQSGVISNVAVFDGGGAVEVGTVGCEGIAGIPMYLGTGTTPHRVMMQIAGTVHRMPVQAFEAAVEDIPALDRILARYVDAYLLQVSQTAACNRMHDLGQRAARWLLMTHDRVGAGTFALTHEFLAIMLGVRRAGVSEAAAELQRAGAIRYSRGRVTIANRAVLEQRSCECYRVVRDRFDGMLKGDAGRGVPHLTAS